MEASRQLLREWHPISRRVRVCGGWHTKSGTSVQRISERLMVKPVLLVDSFCCGWNSFNQPAA
jgi:hypothetical protein